MKRYIILLTIFFVLSPIFVSADTTSILYPIVDGTNDSANWESSTANTVCSGSSCYVDVDESTGTFCSNTSDGDGTYVRSSNTTDSQTFDINESSIPNNATITNIAVTVCSKRGQPGAIFQTRYCLDGSCANSSIDITNTANYVQTTQNFSVNYLKTAGSDIEIGLQSTSNKISRVSAVSTIITYTPPDTTPPTILSVGVDSITTTTARVYWTTNENSTSQVRYGIVHGEYNSTTPLDSTLVTNHSVILSGLAENTYYHTLIYSTDASGNEVTSSDLHFSTLYGGGHTGVPIISGISPSEITSSSIRMSWVTDEIADSQLEYGTTTSYGQITTLDSALVLDHDHSISGLLPGTTYHLRILSRDAFGILGTSNDYIFTTLGGFVPRVKKEIQHGMSEILIDKITDKSAVISWSTDADSTAQVEYGLTSSYSKSTLVTDKELTQNHSIKLDYLIPNTEYHFRVVSTDVAGKISYSIDTTFKTLAGTLDTAPPSVIDDLKVEVLSQTSAKLYWTAPTDQTGVVFYDINSLKESITESNFYSSNAVHDLELTLDDVDINGIQHSFEVVGLKPGEGRYFAIKSKDPYSNVSAISNVVYIQILPNGELADIDVPGKVFNVQAAGLDKLIYISWENPKDEDFVRTRIVRSEGSYPETPSSGKLVYDGDSTKFSDSNLENAKTYYYSIFTYDEVPNYSLPVKFAIAPYTETKHYHVLHVGDGAGQIIFTKDLQFGDTGNEVQQLQEFLAKNPTIYPEGLVTGYFGPLTESAVKLFQKLNNLPETGKLDLATREVIKNTPISNILEEHTAEINTEHFSRDIYLGMQGDDVENLQSFLQKEGFFKYGTITGYFGMITRQAVIDFQKANNIEPSVGYVGPITRGKILELISK